MKATKRLGRARRRFTKFALVAGPPRLRLHLTSSKRWLASFDVFDTVLAWGVLPAPAIWYEVADAARDAEVIEVSPSAFVAARSRAVSSLRTARGEPVFEDLHDRLQQELGLSDQQRDALARIQLQVFGSFLYPVPSATYQLREARRSRPSPKITFISDTHLPSSFIRDQLIRHDFWEDGDSLWVSSEAGVRKYDTRLFQLVRKHEPGAERGLVHTGDNPIADRDAPRWLGFRGRLVTSTHTTAFETALASQCTSSDVLVGLVAGTSRRLRLCTERAHHGHGDGPLAPLEYQAAWPVAVYYAAWVIRMAIEEEVRRIFVVREMEAVFLARLVRVLIRHLDLPIEVDVLPRSQRLLEQGKGGPPKRVVVAFHIAGSRLPDSLARGQPPGDSRAPLPTLLGLDASLPWAGTQSSYRGFFAHATDKGPPRDACDLANVAVNLVAIARAGRGLGGNSTTTPTSADRRPSKEKIPSSGAGALHDRCRLGPFLDHLAGNLRQEHILQLHPANVVPLLREVRRYLALLDERGGQGRLRGRRKIL